MSNKKFDEYLESVRSPDRLNALWVCGNSISKEKFSTLLNYLWVHTEFPNQTPKYIIMALFKKADTNILMNEENFRRYNNFGRYVKVYRGVQDAAENKKKMKAKAFSWTTRKKNAAWFANRWRKDGSGKIYTALIPKQHIFMFSNCRDENEVVLNPDKLIGLMEVENE